VQDTSCRGLGGVPQISLSSPKNGRYRGLITFNKEATMPKKALIAYGTRFGATTNTSEEIAKVLTEADIDTTVVNLKKDKVKDISEYDLVIVGSGMMIHRWTKEPQKFLKKFKKDLADKKVALFVSSGGQAIVEHQKKVEVFKFGRGTTTYEGDEAIGRARQEYLEKKAAEYDLQPIALGLFGGVWDKNKKPWWAGKALDAVKPMLEEAGYSETEPGLYDTRDWDQIRDWAKGLADMI